mmetsp:Transcript_29088/g.62337  ORF Transcript_29088/g.62337 Transcript_29088/m.62337 type:complete len:213 (+) Transcript_29088:1435-2073(+)
MGARGDKKSVLSEPVPVRKVHHDVSRRPGGSNDRGQDGRLSNPLGAVDVDPWGRSSFLCRGVTEKSLCDLFRAIPEHDPFRRGMCREFPFLDHFSRSAVAVGLEGAQDFWHHGTRVGAAWIVAIHKNRCLVFPHNNGIRFIVFYCGICCCFFVTARSCCFGFCFCRAFVVAIGIAVSRFCRRRPSEECCLLGFSQVLFQSAIDPFRKLRMFR